MPAAPWSIAPWLLNGAVAGAIVQAVAAYWDVAWHMDIGRDSFWSPPHDFLIFGGGLGVLGLAALQAAIPPDPLARLRVVLFAGAGLAIMNIFLGEAEWLKVPAWHVSQARPAGFYPLFFSAFAALSLAAARRLTGLPWGATAAALLYWALRAGIVLLLPLLGRSAPVLPPLALLPAAGAFVGRALGREHPPARAAARPAASAHS